MKALQQQLEYTVWSDSKYEYDGINDNMTNTKCNKWHLEFKHPRTCIVLFKCLLFLKYKQVKNDKHKWEGNNLLAVTRFLIICEFRIVFVEIGLIQEQDVCFPILT